MSLFQWYAMCCYWAYRTPAVSMALFGTSDASTAQFREADLLSGPMGAFYNLIAFATAFAMIPIARKMGASKLHGVCLDTWRAGHDGVADDQQHPCHVDHDGVHGA